MANELSIKDEFYKLAGKEEKPAPIKNEFYKLAAPQEKVHEKPITPIGKEFYRLSDKTPPSPKKKDASLRDIAAESAGSAIGQLIGGPLGALAGSYLGKKALSEFDNTDIKESFVRGGRNSATGILLGLADSKKLSKENQSMLGHFAEIIGEATTDIPLMGIAGAQGVKLGAAAGGALGSVIPGAGTATGAAIGGTLGGGAAALAIPQLIKTAYGEYRDFVNKGGKLSFGDFIEIAGKSAKEAGKSAILGGSLGALGKLAPLLRKVPGFAKIMNSKPGAQAVESMVELAGLTGVSSAMEGELPSAQQIADNAVVLLSMKLAGKGAEKTGKFFKELSKPETRTRTEAFMKMLPESVQKNIKERFPKFTEKTQKSQFKELLRDNLGERNRKVYESQVELQEALDKAQKNQKFTSKQMEEMIYYKQKTGNPFVEGDTLEALSKRLPESAKKFVDADVTDHFAKMADMWNKDPHTKNLNPREVLKEIYMPGLFEYDTKTFNEAYNKVASKFNIENPFAKPKEFLTFLDAFREAGLKPRYKNITEFINNYDSKVIKTLSNIKLLEDISKQQSKSPDPYIVNSFDKDAYRAAKEAGYVPMDDVFLRSYKLEPTEKGQVASRMWKTSDAPALVHPDFAQAFEGIFSKEAYKAPSTLGKFLDKTDKLRDVIRFTRVQLSPFHYFSLLESAAGSLGLEKLNWYAEGGRHLKDKAIMADAIEHGVKLDFRKTEGGRKSTDLISMGINQLTKGAELLPDNLASRGAQKGLSLMSKGSNLLFEEFHPRLKISTYNHYVNSEIIKRINAGEKLSEKQVKYIKQDIADLVNNIYGGQNFEYMDFFKSKKNMNGLRRLVGYPDWSISTIRQFLDMTAPGTKGKLGRQFWKKYGVAMVGMHGALKFLNSGWKQTDEENNSIKGLRFDLNKATKGLMTGGPNWYMFPIPDVNIKLSKTGEVFNPGRDAKGRKLVGHFGKQALEIGRYFTDPLSAFFSKTNPLIQVAVDQVFGGTPRGDGSLWMAEGKYDQFGQKKPWDAKKGIEQLGPRAKHALKVFLHFILRTELDNGLAPYVGSLFGSFPVSQAINKYTATPFIEDAFKEEDPERHKEKLESIHSLMRDGGVSERDIKSRTSQVRNAVEIDKIKDDLQTAVENKDTVKVNAIRKRLLNRGLGKVKINNLIKRMGGNPT